LRARIALALPVGIGPRSPGGVGEPQGRPRILALIAVLDSAGRVHVHEGGFRLPPRLRLSQAGLVRTSLLLVRTSGVVLGLVALPGLAHGKEGRADQPRQQGPLLLGWHVGRLMEQGLVAVAVPLSHRAALRWILM
jgi:hypothetical protein